MSPTIFRELGFRFFFFSREEPRMHVHVHCGHGEAKFWIEPEIESADNYGLRGPDLQTARRLIEEHTKMKSETLGTDTSGVEVTHISKHGIWLLINEKERFLSFENFPWFKDASVSAIHNVQLLNEHHLYWPDMDVDLAMESIEDAGGFPLVAK
jgi:hypothetical protein